MDIEEQALKKIVPDGDEQARLEHGIAELIAKVEEIARKLKISLKPILVGSVSKGTHLKSPDIDLFLRFPSEFDKDEIGEIDKAIGKSILEETEERYAEHPYISGIWQGFRTDLVPCYDVPSGRGKISAVDRTPFHTRFIRENLRLEQRNEVRLLKQFMKGVGIYGAEAKIQGFSGYLCELLVLKHGDFKAVVRAAAKWSPPVRYELADREIEKFDEPFVFVDPVDSGRNVASPVSSEKLELFIEACRAFSKSPDMRFFFPEEQKPWANERLAAALKGHPGAILIVLPHLGVVDDILWPQLRKTGRSIFETLEREGFRPSHISLRAEDDRNLILIDCENRELSPTMVHQGPPENSAEVDNFLEKWNGRGLSDPVVQDGKWQIELPREIRTPEDFLLKKFESVRLGKGFRKIGAFSVLTGDKLFISRAEYAKILTAYFDERKPWER